MTADTPKSRSGERVEVTPRTTRKVPCPVCNNTQRHREGCGYGVIEADLAAAREALAAKDAEIARLRNYRRGRMHPSWREKSREELLDALEFQGAMTAALSDSQNKDHELIVNLRARAEAAEAILREQESMLCGVGPINCRNDAQHDRNKQGDRCLYCALEAAEARVRELEAERDGLRGIILWALGENGEFPERPERVHGKPYPMYYWRREMREKLDALARRQAPAAEPESYAPNGMGREDEG